MALRGKPPEDTDRRLRFLMFGPAGVGKTTAAIQLPRPYLIDCEGGARHYGDKIADAGGVVFETNDLAEILEEVRALTTEEHDFGSLIIDPFTTAYEVELEKGEREVGTNFGRHYGYANKRCKELFRLLDLVDMNVCVTCHEKNEYGDNMQVRQTTYDGWKRLDYRFDLVLELRREGASRAACVRKTRLPGFPDGSVFEWSFDALAERYGRAALERKPEVIEFASEEQRLEFVNLVQIHKVDPDLVNRWKDKAGIEEISDFTAPQIQACIAYIQNKYGEGPF